MWIGWRAGLRVSGTARGSGCTLKELFPKHALFERSPVLPPSASKGNTADFSLPRHIQRTSDTIVPTTHLDPIEKIKDDYLPCLFFTFSRRKCEANALELGDSTTSR